MLADDARLSDRARELIAQAQADRLTIFASDAHISCYDVATVW